MEGAVHAAPAHGHAAPADGYDLAPGETLVPGSVSMAPMAAPVAGGEELAAPESASDAPVEAEAAPEAETEAAAPEADAAGEATSDVPPAPTPDATVN